MGYLHRQILFTKSTFKDRASVRVFLFIFKRTSYYSAHAVLLFTYLQGSYF